MTALWFTWFRNKWCSSIGIRSHRIYSVCIYISYEFYIRSTYGLSHLRNMLQPQWSMSKEPLGTEISSFLSEAGCLLSTWIFYLVFIYSVTVLISLRVNHLKEYKWRRLSSSHSFARFTTIQGSPNQAIFLTLSLKKTFACFVMQE